MFGYILIRMIFWELVKVFVLCLIAITGILLMAGIVAEASQQGLNPAQILAIIPLLIPSTLPYTIPATTLFATCIVYGRLSADNEILAIRASGHPLNQGRRASGPARPLDQCRHHGPVLPRHSAHPPPDALPVPRRRRGTALLSPEQEQPAHAPAV